MSEVSNTTDITMSVMERIKTLETDGTLKLPDHYEVGNALKSAWLKIQKTVDRNRKPALQVCTKVSIANSLFDMAIQGLSPSKNQCYFIVRGNELTLMRSYFGTIAAIKRINGVTNVIAQVIYQGDTFEYSIDGGIIKVLKHEQKFENIDPEKMVGAYCIITQNGNVFTEIMTIKQIRQAWTRTQTGGGVQKEFPDQMAKRTVINRAAKMFVNTSCDTDYLTNAINETTENEFVPEADEQEPETEPVQIPDEPMTALEGVQENVQIPVPDEKEDDVLTDETEEGPGF